ncbi:MAG: hypothetical protein GQ532_09910 [Methylomarinum sp.]|nr:hypothetical protein [Methylomarinum sp.]
MTFLKYSLHEDDISQALIQRLSDAEIDALAELLKNKGYKNWLRWFFAAHKQIETWFCLTPRKQDKYLKDLSHEDRLLMIYGTIWYSQLAHVTHHPFQDTDTQRDREGYSRKGARGAVCVTALYALMDRQIGWPFAVACPFPGW